MESIDAFLGGKVRLKQSDKAFKGTSDAVLVAAAVSAKPGETVLDVGTGNGVISLCLNARIHGLDFTGIDCQDEVLTLAKENTKLNRVKFTPVLADLAIIPSPIHGKQFHHVVTNPPFYTEPHQRKAPQQAIACHQSVSLTDWLKFCLRHVRAKGTLTVINRTEALPEILSALEGKIGAMEVFPIASKENEPAPRIIIRGRMNSRKPLCLYPPLIMHQRDGKRTTLAEQLLRDGIGIDMVLGLDI